MPTIEKTQEEIVKDVVVGDKIVIEEANSEI